MEKGTTAKRLPIGVIGIPFSKGQPRGGTEHGPSILRENGLVAKIERFGNKVVDYGDLTLDVVENDKPWNNVKNPRTVGMANKKVAECVEKITRGGEQVALTLGGDHSIAIGSIFGHCQSLPDMVMVWVDAHADLNTPLSSPTGNIHGMPLSFVLKEMEQYSPTLPGFEWCKPCLSVKDMVYIGLRDVDEAERAFMSQIGIASFSMQEIDKHGIKGIMEWALKTVDPCGKRPIHLSFDVDAMDPEYAPSTGTPVAGGLTRREMFFIAEEVAATGRLSCLDVVEVNPVLGNDEERKKTVLSTVDVVSHFFGQRREGNVSANFQLPVPKS
ncbi:arginase-1-like [Babylonia areolata]|uniref:arginase-1-like n=1 Tax=Babylonia areolata TaxID=304850 RepID=UPI003FD0A8DF